MSDDLFLLPPASLTVFCCHGLPPNPCPLGEHPPGIGAPRERLHMVRRRADASLRRGVTVVVR